MKITEEQYLNAVSIHKLSNRCNCLKCELIKDNVIEELEGKKIPINKIFRYKPYLFYDKFLFEFYGKKINFKKNPTYLDFQKNLEKILS